MGNQTNNTLLKDNEWVSVQGKFCKVVAFNPLANVANGKVIALDSTTPYGSIVIDEVELKKLQTPITGFVTHRIDFMNLWQVFKERGVKEDEVVVVVWTRENYKSKIYKFLSSIQPKMIVMVFSQEGYLLVSDSSYKPELTGEARLLKQKPLEELKPAIMK